MYVSTQFLLRETVELSRVPDGALFFSYARSGDTCANAGRVFHQQTVCKIGRVGINQTVCDKWCFREVGEGKIAFKGRADSRANTARGSKLGDDSTTHAEIAERIGPVDMFMHVAACR